MRTKFSFWPIFLLIYSQSHAQLGVGTVEPDPSAMLDVVSNNSGILVPRIALASTTDATTIANGNVESLLVYNTATAMDVVPGFYYWTDGSWNRLAIELDIRSLPRDVTSTDGSITGVVPNAALAPMDLEVNVDGTTLEVSSTNGVQVRDSGIGTLQIADGTIVEVDLANGAVTTAKILDATVAEADLADGAVTTAKILDATVAEADLADGAVTTAKILDSTVMGSDLADGAVTSAKILDATVVEVDLADGAVTSTKILDATIAEADLADDAVTIAKISSNGVGDANRVLGTDAIGNPQWQDAVTLATSLGEDVTSTDGSITGVMPNAVLTNMDLKVNVDGTTLEVNPTNGIQVRDNGIGTPKIADNAVNGTKIQVAGEVQGALLFNNGTDWVSLPNGTPGQVLAMDTTGTAPEWITTDPGPSVRIGEFIYAKSGRTLADGYLPVNPGAVTNGAVDFPLWAAQYPEFVSGNDILFPNNVQGMFLRNIGGNAGTEGNFQEDATAFPTNPFSIGGSGEHTHNVSDELQSVTVSSGSVAGFNNIASNASGTAQSSSILSHTHTVTGGAHSHTISGGDTETRPVNRAYQLYTIVDTYTGF